MADKYWYRVEVSDSGKTVTIKKVERRENDTSDVFFVLAIDEKQAGRKAFNEYMRVAQARRRAKLIAEGKCPWCSRKNDRGSGKRCSICLRSNLGYEARRRARVKGEDIPRPDRAVAVEKRKSADREAIRADVLIEVQRAWTNARTHGQFSQWLADQVEAASGKKVA